MEQGTAALGSVRVPAGRVLVVDDEALIRWAAGSILSDVGFLVVEAADLAGARRLVSAGRIDLALLDVRLPDGDGLSLMRELHLAQPACRFIMMTACRTPELTLEADSARVPVLDKPFDMPTLASLVGDVMRADGTLPADASSPDD